MSVLKKGQKRKITRLEVQKRNPRRVSVYLDGSFALGLEIRVAQEKGLHKGLELSQSQLEKLLLAEERSRAKNYALDFIGYRARSVWEVRQRLARRDHSQEIIDDVIADLQQAGFLDDTQFSARWAQGRMATKPLGEHLLRKELRLKGVSQEIVEKTVAGTFAGISQPELATRLLETRRKRYQGLPRAKARRRMADFLIRRGFSREAVWQAVGQIMDQGDWSDDQTPDRDLSENTSQREGR